MKKKVFIRNIILFFSFIAFSNSASSQNVKVYGSITNALNNEPIPFANIIIEGTTIGATSDIDGNYVSLDLIAGAYNFKSLREANRKAMIEIVDTKIKQMTNKKIFIIKYKKLTDYILFSD